VPPTKKINDMRHVRVAFSFTVLEKCRKAGVDPWPWQSSGSNTDQSHRRHHISCLCLNISPEPTAEAPRRSGEGRVYSRTSRKRFFVLRNDHNAAPALAVSVYRSGSACSNSLLLELISDCLVVSGDDSRLDMLGLAAVGKLTPQAAMPANFRSRGGPGCLL